MAVNILQVCVDAFQPGRQLPTLSR